MKREAIAAMAVMVALGTPSIFAQIAGGEQERADPLMKPSVLVRGERVREIDDPGTGARWMLLRDAVRPAGPGRFVLLEGPARNPGSGSSGAAQRLDRAQQLDAAVRPVIRAGDMLIVEEHSPVIDARLDAVALGSAVQGAEFSARLKIGDKVVRVVAIAAGHAVFASAGGAAR